MSLVDRFQRCRWSPIRRQMDAMKPGDEFYIAAGLLYAARTNAARLREAYADGRTWSVRAYGDGYRVVRVS